MRRRLFQSVASVALVVAVLLPVGTQPAAALPPTTVGTQSITLDDIKKWIGIAKDAYDVLRGILGGGGPSISDAIRQINAKIEEAKTQILQHIDAIATAEARACARHHVIEFADINLFNPDVLQSWAQNVTGCATLIDSLIDAVTDKAQSDELGLALNIAGPIALAARMKAGFGTALLTQTLRHGNHAIIPKLAPACRQWTLREGSAPVVEVYYECTAHNGDKALGYQNYYGGQPQGPPIDKPAVENQATARTSRAVAQAVLPSLQF